MNLTVIPLSDLSAAIRCDEGRTGLFGCLQCESCTHETDGDYGEYRWKSCDRFPNISAIKAFPFKVAPGCFRLDPEQTEFGKLIWHDALIEKHGFPSHSGISAIINNQNAYGRISQAVLSDATIELIYQAATEAIVWEDYLDGTPGGEAEHREFRASVSKKCSDFEWSVSGRGEDVSEGSSRNFTNMESVQQHVESLIREQIIREIISQSPLTAIDIAGRNP